jgi:hypothetical protein
MCAVLREDGLCLVILLAEGVCRGRLRIRSEMHCLKRVAFTDVLTATSACKDRLTDPIFLRISQLEM